MRSSKGSIFIISGPSGAGKSTVLNKVLNSLDKAFFSISATTRPPREGEEDGKHYHFVSRDEFERMIKEDELIEHAEYVGNYYGTPLKPISDYTGKGYDVFLDVEIMGKKQVSEKLPEAISIFIAPPDLQALENRLRARGTETEEKILSRLNTAKIEMLHAGLYDYVVTNDDADRAADEILDIVKSAHKINLKET